MSGRVAAALLLMAIVPAWAQPAANRPLSARRPNVDLATDRVIVKWRTSGVAAVQIPEAADRARRLTSVTGVSVRSVRNIRQALDVVQIDHPRAGDSMRATLSRLELDPGVEYAEADARRYVESTPNDPRFVAGSDSVGSWEGQWYLLPSSATTPAAIDATDAWDVTMGSSSIVVAVVDTGVELSHPDLSTKFLAGYDFVSCDQGDTLNSSGQDTGQCSASGSAATYLNANDGHGWDSDPTDPGDWLSATDLTNSLFAGCGGGTGGTEPLPSSWHGTKVSGIIGAITNNGIGIAGVAPAVMLLPVRVLGKCSGSISDIAAGILWAAGLTVTGAPTNPTPAKIINLSLGAATACSQTEQSAISDAIAAGVLVVAAAGNDGGPVNAPANCSGVLSVAGLRQTGTKVGYSSLSTSSTAITMAAPAGNCVNENSDGTFISPDLPCLYSIETTSDEGSTTPVGAFYTYALFNAGYSGNSDNVASVGTSFSSPLVSGVAALMLSAQSSLSPSQIIARMQASALPFPTSSSTSSTQCQLEPTTTDSNGFYTDTSQDVECVCTTATCGAGMVNALAAVNQAVAPFVSITPSTDAALPGQRVTLDGSGSTATAGRTIVSWQWSSSPGVDIENANTSVATFVFPAFRTITFTLTITDNTGATDSGTATVSGTFGKAGGGGAFGAELVALAALAAARVARQRRSIC